MYTYSNACNMSNVYMYSEMEPILNQLLLYRSKFVPQWFLRRWIFF